MGWFSELSAEAEMAMNAPTQCSAMTCERARARFGVFVVILHAITARLVLNSWIRTFWARIFQTTTSAPSRPRLVVLVHEVHGGRQIPRVRVAMFNRFALASSGAPRYSCLRLWGRMLSLYRLSNGFGCH